MDISFKSMTNKWNFIWFIGLIISSALSLMLGWKLVDYLRKKSSSTDKVWKLTIPIFATPVAVFLLLSFFSSMGICDRIIADSFSFGLLLGIIGKLQAKSLESDNVKLIAHLPNGRSIDVWLDSSHVLVGEARNKIAEELKIVPASRICIETGKGCLIEDLSSKLFPIINADGTNAVADFFGFVTTSCYIFIREEEKTVSFQLPADTEDKASKSQYSFISMLHSRGGETKYGDLFSLTAKSSASDTLFYVQEVDKFVGATPTVNLSSLIKFVSWDASNAAMNAAENVSEAGDMLSTRSDAGAAAAAGVTASATAGNNAKAKTPSRQPGDGETVKNGDVVLLDCNGK